MQRNLMSPTYTRAFQNCIVLTRERQKNGRDNGVAELFEYVMSMCIKSFIVSAVKVLQYPTGNGSGTWTRQFDNWMIVIITMRHMHNNNNMKIKKKRDDTARESFSQRRWKAPRFVLLWTGVQETSNKIMCLLESGVYVIRSMWLFPSVWLPPPTFSICQGSCYRDMWYK